MIETRTQVKYHDSGGFASGSLCALCEALPQLVVSLPILCYIESMSITQTVDIPASHKLTIDVPSEVPTGPAVLTFTPAPKRKLTVEEEVEFFKQNADRLNKQAEETLEFLCDATKEYFEQRRKETGP